jgi:hypothetical protein
MTKGIAIFLLSILCALVSCSSEGLSAKQCQSIVDRELAFKNSLLKSSSPNPIAGDSSNQAVASCVSGHSYTREDFKCITSADTELAMSRCMAQAHEKMQ